MKHRATLLRRRSTTLLTMNFTPLANTRAAAGALAILLALTATTPALAQWKWRDKNGHVTVSDRPPPRDVADQDILQRPNVVARPAAVVASAAEPAASAAAPRLMVDKDLEAKKRNAEAEQLAKTKAEEEKLNVQRAENCRRARAQMAAIDSGQRMARFNDKGEREVLDDAGRAAEARRAREVMASECK